MKTKQLLLLISFFTIPALQTSAQSVPVNAENKISVIPQPLSVTAASGSFDIKPGTSILIDPGNADLKRNASILSSHIKSLTGYSVPVKTNGKTANSIRLTLSDAPDSLGKEGYLMISGPEGVTIRANSAQGIFYGMQTLYQLMPVNKAALGELQMADGGPVRALCC